MSFQFDPDSRAFVDDPYPIYKILRDQHPVYRHEPSGFTIVTRFDDVAAILNDYAAFSSSHGNALVDSPLRVGRTLGSTDPPRHDQLRHIVMKGFTPAKIQAMQPEIKRRTENVLGDFVERRECEFMADIARPVLYGTLGRMLGLDGEAADRATDLSREIFHTAAGALGPASRPGLMEGVFALLTEQLERRRADRGDDLFSFLLEAQEAGGQISDGEILGNMSTVLLAGNASIGHFISNVIHALWLHPDQRATLRGAPDRIDAAINEAVRWDTSTQAFGRTTTREVSLHGVTVPSGSRIVVCYAAANRDERAIADPDRFDIGRGRVRHFGFGSGPHICLGATAARAMLRTILEPLLDIAGDYDLDITRSERVGHMMVRGFYKLPMGW